MPNIFLIADIHFGHGKIIHYENRPFKNTDEMDETIIHNWNNTVGADDEVFLQAFDKRICFTSSVVANGLGKPGIHIVKRLK